MTKIYLSASYPRKKELQGYDHVLTALGYEITSTWLQEPDCFDDGVSMPAGPDYTGMAERDFVDIDAADSVIAFTEPPGGPGRGGRHVECGYAMAKGKRIHVVGHRENTFHHMPDVHYHIDWQSCFEWFQFQAPSKRRHCLGPNNYIRPFGHKTDQPDQIRTFDTGATRDTDTGKLKFSGFLSPLVLHRFAQYMHTHRTQRDGSLRDPDNWQKGISLTAYEDSLVRHVMDIWLHHRGFSDLAVTPIEEALCATMFNTMGFLHEYLKAQRATKQDI